MVLRVELLSEEREGTIEGHRLEIAVGRQKVESVADRKASEEGVDHADLDAAPPAVVSERSRLQNVQVRKRSAL